MPRGECSSLPRTVDTGVASYEAFASHNVRRAVCLPVLEQCSKVPRFELCVNWIPALSASHRTRQLVKCYKTKSLLWDTNILNIIIKKERRLVARNIATVNESPVTKNLRVTANLPLVVIALRMDVSRFFTAGSINVIKCSKSCLDIRKKFGTSSSNLTSSRSLFLYSNNFSINYFEPPTGFTSLFLLFFPNNRRYHNKSSGISRKKNILSRLSSLRMRVVRLLAVSIRGYKLAAS
ncbi:hypothetical protein J6590_084031 [Homalodisca vitripennis]|nr:hypothetical protein J6590_084031 [Homalodisca vitripennis]